GDGVTPEGWRGRGVRRSGEGRENGVGRPARPGNLAPGGGATGPSGYNRVAGGPHRRAPPGPDLRTAPAYHRGQDLAPVAARPRGRRAPRHPAAGRAGRRPAVAEPGPGGARAGPALPRSTPRRTAPPRAAARGGRGRRPHRRGRPPGPARVRL